MMNRGWRVVVGWPGYEVSDAGHVYSTKSDLYLATGKDKDGYLTVQVTVKNKSTRLWVRRVACRAFRGPRPSPRYEVRHLNGNRINNRSENLAWGTRKQNAADRERHGRTAHSERNRGGGKLTSAQARKIRSLIGKVRYVDIAERFGISITTVVLIKSGRLWRRA